MKETVVRYARYGVGVDGWYAEPASRIVAAMGWEELDERGERFAAFARATLKNPCLFAVQVVSPRGRVRTEYRR